MLAVAAPEVAKPEDFATAFATLPEVAATPSEMIASATQFISQPVVQQTPTRFGAAEPPAALRRSAARAQADGTAPGTHLVQLGSFSSEAGARRAWGIYAKRFPQLSAFDMVITKAVVRGKTYYRVSAGGLRRAEASSMCSTVRAQGQGCYAWAEGRPMPGAVHTGVRMARR